MDFVAIDVETANADLSSICQVGIASFRDGQLVETWGSLVNPEDEFDPINISIHGIDEYQVKNSPTWRHVFPSVVPRLQNRIVVSHTPFDRTAVTNDCDRYGVAPFACTWLDSARIVRRAWQDLAKSGYGLSHVAQKLEIKYREHDAVEDARCAGEIVLRAIAETGLSLEQWLTRVQQPIDPSAADNRRDGNPDGELFGEILVFTGALSIPRHEAADVAASAGCRVDEGVTKHTTLLVVGDQDVRKLHGHEKSSKHRKAEQLKRMDSPIRILRESDFRRIVMRSAAAAV